MFALMVFRHSLVHAHAAIAQPRLLHVGLQAPAKKESAPKENVSLGPAVREGENVFAVAHIFASFNDTFVVMSQSVLLSQM